jgi:DNA-directed RNA polymerase
MYSVDWLEDFRDNLQAQLPAELFDSLPPLPPKGSLDLEDVRTSDFFFS